jgi:hypothetical protein
MTYLTRKAITGKAYDSLGLKPKVLHWRRSGAITRTGLIPVSEGK